MGLFESGESSELEVMIECESLELFGGVILSISLIRRVRIDRSLDEHILVILERLIVHICDKSNPQKSAQISFLREHESNAPPEVTPFDLIPHLCEQRS